MKYIAAILLFCALCTGQTTPNLGLNIPITGAPNWGPLLNQNWSLIDAINPASKGNNNTFTGNNTFSAGQNSITVYNQNGYLFIDKNFFPATQAGFNSALIAAEVINGVVIIPPNTTVPITATQQIGTSGHPVVVVIESGSSIACNVSGTVDCLQVANQSSIIGRTPGSSPVISCLGTMRSCVTNADKSGAQEFFAIEGVNIASTAGATTSVALLDIEGVGVNSTVKDVVIAVCPSACVNVSNAGVAVGNSDATFRNVWINGASATTNTQALIITTNASGAVNSSINFFGGAIEHSGGTKPLVTITGTASASHSIGFFGTAFEIFSSSVSDGIDVTSSTMACFNCRFSGTGGNFGSVISLATAGQLTIDHLVLDNTASTNTILDSVNGISTGNIPFIGYYSTAPILLKTPQLLGLTNATGLQLFNSSTTCTTGASVGAICTTGAITLPIAYSDTSYRLSCTGQGPTNVPVVQTYTKSNTTFTITIAALTAAAATFTSYDCIAGHN